MKIYKHRENGKRYELIADYGGIGEFYQIDERGNRERDYKHEPIRKILKFERLEEVCDAATGA